MDPQAIAEKTIEDREAVKVVEVLPRFADGGAFVKVSHSPGQNMVELERRLKTYLEENPIHPWFNPFRRIRTFLVRGRPWLEDLSRIPSSFVKVEFVSTEPGKPAQELSPETLFSLFRKYGRMLDIRTQPADSKEVPRYAVLIYRKTRHAVAAKNCLHGFVVGAEEGGGKAGTVLKTSYQQIHKAHWILDWIFSHPRITLPILVAFLGTFTVAVFDP